jgi:hypothetical protein
MATPIYVASTGSDANNGETPATAKLTIHGAALVVDDGGEILVLTDLTSTSLALQTNSYNTKAFTVKGWDSATASAATRTFTTTANRAIDVNDATATTKLIALEDMRVINNHSTAGDAVRITTNDGANRPLSFTRSVLHGKGTGWGVQGHVNTGSTRVYTFIDSEIKGNLAAEIAGIAALVSVNSTWEGTHATTSSPILLSGTVGRVDFTGGEIIGAAASAAGLDNGTGGTTLVRVRGVEFNCAGAGLRARGPLAMLDVEGCTIVSGGAAVNVTLFVDNQAGAVRHFRIVGNDLRKTVVTAHNLSIGGYGDGAGNALLESGLVAGNIIAGGDRALVCKSSNVDILRNRIMQHATSTAEAALISGSVGTLFQNNTVYSAGTGMALGINRNQVGGAKEVAEYCVVDRNVLVAANGFALGVAAKTTETLNNIITRNLYHRVAGTGLASIHNVTQNTLAAMQAKWAADYAGTGYAYNDSDSMVDDPLLVSTDPDDDKFLMVGSGSPAKAMGAGADIGGSVPSSTHQVHLMRATF